MALLLKDAEEKRRRGEEETIEPEAKSSPILKKCGMVWTSFRTKKHWRRVFTSGIESETGLIQTLYSFAVFVLKQNNVSRNS